MADDSNAADQNDVYIELKFPVNSNLNEKKAVLQSCGCTDSEIQM